ncbi:hypothetical protein EJB05_09724, partial [Eragrostis curvula]
MASQVLVSASTGVTNNLLSKLTSLLVEHAAKLKTSEREEVIFIRGELSSMSAVLRESAMMEPQDVKVMEWMRQVREVAYDAEDCVDLFLAGAGRKLTRSPSILAALGLQTNLPPRHHRYKVHDSVPTSDDTIDLGSSSVVTVDPQLILMQHTAPVAIQGPTKHLHQLLAAEEKHATVTSIVGQPGIGKTTLALQVYTTVKEPFHCKVYIYVGQRASVWRVLLNIISQVSRQRKHDGIANERQAMNKIRTLLDNKRYEGTS